MPSDTTPVTDLASKEVFTADGARVGRVIDVLVDLEADVPVALALSDVDEGTVGGLPNGAAGVRVPFRLVRGVGDVIVLRSAAHEAALPLPGGRGGSGTGGADGSTSADGDAPTAGGSASTGDDPIV
ncbi:PRC-barrel domain-containing protein [Halobaculum gomorrense]|uniref:Sporulation protein YlmC, PRC-barrel domain family n=1 Tax=Halobaculum gomorrense TaxID=43928 RepID=A0A1M5UB09_9EURY|nr:PRC-barrel domain-containing protein [Halobaculum gomorrense]SHH60157.1 Sporulation protein YlmC, PRC-barrel domain family [Halobaculum gomorrense]